MEIAAPFVRQIISKFIKEAGPAELRKRMTKAIPKVVAGMEAKGMTLVYADATICIRDAIFRLVRSVVPSGDISDLIRDHIDDKVVAIVEPTVTEGTTTKALVQKTLDGIIEVVF